MVSGLTARQKACLEAIKRLTVDGVAPSYEEIGAAIGLKSRSAVIGAIRALAYRGYVSYLPRRARSVAIIERGPPAMLADWTTAQLLEFRNHVDAELVARS